MKTEREIRFNIDLDLGEATPKYLVGMRDVALRENGSQSSETYVYIEQTRVKSLQLLNFDYAEQAFIQNNDDVSSVIIRWWDVDEAAITIDDTTSYEVELDPGEMTGITRVRRHSQTANRGGIEFDLTGGAPGEFAEVYIVVAGPSFTRAVDSDDGSVTGDTEIINPEDGPIPRLGLIAEYLFQYIDGSLAIDTSDNGFDATIYGGVTQVAGAIRDSVLLNGTTGYLRELGPDVSATIAGGSGSVSISSWAKTTYSGGGRPTIWYFNTVGGGNRFGLSGSHGGFSNKVSIYDSGTNTNYPSITINDGSWHHVVWTLDGVTGDSRIYIDNVLQTIANFTTATRIVATDPFLLGAELDPPASVGDYWPGGLDQIRIYDKVLNSSEISQLFNEKIV